MLRESVQDFINRQKTNILNDKLKLYNNTSDIQQNENNDDKNVIVHNSNINSEEKENISSHFTWINVPKMLKYGEYSPNNPKMRVATQPYLGLGEYEQRKQLLMEQRKADYQQYTEKLKRPMEQDITILKNSLRSSRLVSNSCDKYVQTDIQNINTQLIQCDVPLQLQREKEKNKSSNERDVKTQSQIENSIIRHNINADTTPTFKNNSPRAKLMADLQSSYFPSSLKLPVFVSENEEKLEKIRKQEKYLAELRQQIEDKQKLVQKHKEQEKLEYEMALKKFDTQIKNCNMNEKPVRGLHSYSSDAFMKEKSEKTCIQNSKYTSKLVDGNVTHRSEPEKKNTFKYSPPLHKRDKPPYSFNIPMNSVFANSFPVKDKRVKDSKLTLNSNNDTTTTVKESQKRNSHVSTILDESLPIPVLKAQSPVAKELINAVAVQSKTSDAMRKLQDKWQIPAVQKNIIKISDRQLEGGNGNQGILTQLGAIRLQLQQEQLRLDETLRKRGTSQTVVQADVHHHK